MIFEILIQNTPRGKRTISEKRGRTERKKIRQLNRENIDHNNDDILVSLFLFDVIIIE